jgi:FRG domain
VRKKKMSNKPIKSIREFIYNVLSIRKSWYSEDPHREIWFRGINDSSFSLQPGSYRHTNYDERSAALSFRAKVPSYIARQPSDDWEWYYLMQHYGLPTRLLDWTENPLFALFFAIRSIDPKTMLQSGKKPCVWVIDPVYLNKKMHGCNEEAILVPKISPKSEFNYWLPNCCEPKTFKAGSRFTDNKKPLAIYPSRYNDRIVAQRGVFTVHGSDDIGLEKLPTLASRINKVLIKPAKCTELLNDLWALGVSDSVLFPEPHYVAQDLKREYGGL